MPELNLLLTLCVRHYPTDESKELFVKSSKLIEQPTAIEIGNI